jgi:transposase
MWRVCQICITYYNHCLKWQSGLNKVCRSWWIMKLWYSTLFDLTLFSISKSRFSMSNFEFQNLGCSDFVKCKNDLNKVCRSWWVMKLWYSSLFDLTLFTHPNFYLKLLILKFKIWIVNKDSDWEMPKMKLVDLGELYNFVVDDF